MADSSFPTLISKDTAANAVGNPIYIDGGTGATIATVTNVTTVGTITNDVGVTASDLDIRSLVQGTGNDNVSIWANTAKDGTGTDYIPLVDADGKLIISNPSGTEYTEDDAAVTATGTVILAERDDALAGITPVEGDWSKLYVNANGALWVKQDGTVTVDANSSNVTVDNGSGAAAVNIQDGGNTITVDGTVTVQDGGGSITVDASDLDIRNLNLTDDAVKISKDANANSYTNPIYVTNVAGAVSATEVHDYGTTTDTGDNDYTVLGSTFLCKSVIFAASGGMKATVLAGPVGTLVTKAVGFIPHQGGTFQMVFDPPIEVPVASTGTLRVTMTNREGSAMSVYSTIIGNDLP